MTMGKISKITLVVLLVFTIFIVGCSNSASNDSSSEEVIKIGVIQPFSGPNAQAGEETFKGNELAVEEINANGGLLGKKIKLVKADATNAQEAISEAERLITKEKVDIITGTYLSGVAYPATQIANKHNVLYWETNALAPNITQQGFKNVIRIGQNSETFSSVAVDSIKNVIAPALGKSIKDLKIVIIHEQSIYGTSIGEMEEERLKDLGAQVLKRIPYDPAAADLSSVVNLSKNEDPDIWLRTGYVNDGSLLLKQARDIGWRPPVIMGVADDSTYLLDALGKDGMEGILSISYPPYDVSEEYAPGVDAMMKSYNKKYGSDPKIPQTLVSFGGTKILFDLIKNAESTNADKIREAALEMDVEIGGTYPTGYGVKLDPKTLDNTKAFPVLTQWQDGEIRTIYPSEAVGTDAKIKLPLSGW
jgi:branched-chain amino acid transport system substrate-binding protein